MALALQDGTTGLLIERVVLLEVERIGIKDVHVMDVHVMDAGPSNSIYLFIYLPGLSFLSASALGNGMLTNCRLDLACWQIQIWLDLTN